MPKDYLDLDAVQEAVDLDALKERPSQGLGQYAIGLAESVPQTAVGLGRELVRFGQDITSIPSRLAQAGQIDWGEAVTHPSQLGRAAMETGRQIIEPLAQALPEISGATIGTLLGGPGGAPLGAATMRELVGILEGLPARERGQAAGSAMLTTAIGQRVPQALELARKAPGRYLSLPAERHAAAGQILEKIPERFGVTDASVTAAYSNAEQLSRAAAKVREDVRVSEQAGGPILDHVRRFREIQTEAQTLGEQIDTLQRAGQPVPKQLEARLDALKEQANPKNSTIMRWLTTSPLDTFRSTTRGIAGDLKANPITELRDTRLINRLNRIADQATEASKKGGATAEGVDRIIKSVNHEISQSSGAVAGVWKQTLRSLHEDMRTAAETTGNPAFEAYSKAIESARLNFLRQDITEVVNLAANRLQRTGQTGITSPGKIINWMRDNPEWVAAVEKTRPGLLQSIQSDIQAATPIANIRAASIPGVMAGSARPVLGAATGHYLGRLLGLSPGSGEALGAIFGSSGWLMEHMGAIQMSPEYIRSSFQPVRRMPSRAGSLAGAVIGPRIGREQLPVELE